MLKRDNWTTDEAIDILNGSTIAWCSEGGDIKDNPEYYNNLDRNKGINKVISDIRIYDRWHKKVWTNDELIEFIDEAKIPFRMDECKGWSKEEWNSKGEWNQGLEQCVIQLWDLKADPEESYSAMALDTETGQIVVISPPLPQ
jgi:hypothetical protein